ncbi:MAG: pilus assembly protein PilM [Lachnospiraceae bacterium]|nr:pilus assembly protein PilM [Lachnospiraceae bacterium]
MANVLGIDIGHESLKLVLVSGKKIKKTVVAEMPENLVKNGIVVSQETMGEFLRETMKANGISAGKAALVMMGERVYIRNVTMPLMTGDQLLYNLPYEFRDYITEELKDYIFDYAVRSVNEEERTIDVLAAAVPKELIESSRAMLRKAGLKLAKAAPLISSYRALIREYETKNETRDYCILNLGYQSIRMDVFHGEEYLTTHVLDTGLSTVERMMAETMGVDEHIAHTYLITNHKDCQDSDECKNAFTNIAVELMRTMNFLRYSMQDNNLDEIWVCGGGANISNLKAAIAEQLDMPVYSAWEKFCQDANKNVEEGDSLLQAMGILQDM